MKNRYERVARLNRIILALEALHIEHRGQGGTFMTGCLECDVEGGESMYEWLAYAIAKDACKAVSSLPEPEITGFWASMLHLLAAEGLDVKSFLNEFKRLKASGPGRCRHFRAGWIIGWIASQLQ